MCPYPHGNRISHLVMPAHLVVSAYFRILSSERFIVTIKSILILLDDNNGQIKVAI
jgi:hypothetical protein